MASTNFTDFYRSTFMGQRDQVKTEKEAEKAEAKAASAAKAAQEAQDKAKAVEGLKNAQEKVNSFLKNLRDSVEKAAQDTTNMIKEVPKIPEEAKKIEPIEDENVVEYTYKAGDTFGQVIKDLGLQTDAGLWGADGDVAYYTQQLAEQGALDNRGNVPIGTKIKLRRRGAPEIVMSEEQVSIPGTTYDATLPRQTVTSKSARLV